MFVQVNCSGHKKYFFLHFLPVATLALLSSRLQLGTTASQTSIHSFSLQFLSLYSGVTLLYCAGLFSISVIYLSLSKSSLDPWCMDLLATADENLVAEQIGWTCGCFVACVHKQVFPFCISLPPPTAERPPHRPENKACCIWKNVAMKQPSILCFYSRQHVSSQR
jgi:hypothetical protein